MGKNYVYCRQNTFKKYNKIRKLLRIKQDCTVVNAITNLLSAAKLSTEWLKGLSDQEYKLINVF